MTNDERFELVLLENRENVQYLSEREKSRLKFLRGLKEIELKYHNSYNYKWEKR
jgi:hypothetical protein